MPPTNKNVNIDLRGGHAVHTAAVVRDYISQPRISKFLKLSKNFF